MTITPQLFKEYEVPTPRVLRSVYHETRAAHFSPCQLYRYTLTIVWDAGLAPCQFVGLNPSTATEYIDDPTVRRCKDYARRWGYGALVMTNLFAWRDTDPKKMMLQKEPVGPENDKYLGMVAAGAGVTIAAWGKDGRFINREAHVRELLPRLHYLKLNDDGTPSHPLYLKKELVPIPFTT